MMHYFQQLIQFAQHNTIMFVCIVIAIFLAIFILTILLLNPTTETRAVDNQDIQAIAGDDVFVTQLDMARAYIELGNLILAKQILENVILHGGSNQQHIAQELLLTL